MHTHGTRRRFMVGTLLLFPITFCFWYFSQAPSHDRAWTTDQAILPNVRFDDNSVTIDNIRNFTYASTTSYTPSYYSRTILLDSVRSVDYIVEPFGSIGAAHTFLSFGFDDGTYLAISVEIRKEVGESFSPWKGLIRQFELMYVIADEHDVVDLRANHRKHDVYLYPSTVSREDARALFVDMLTRTQELQSKPEFYNTVTSNCTTNIVHHVNKLRDEPISWDRRMLFPEDSDVLAHELGLITPEMTVEEARVKYRINEKAEQYADDPEFSKKIRE
jgi:Domain of unknown function (DUF4105)